MRPIAALVDGHDHAARLYQGIAVLADGEAEHLCRSRANRGDDVNAWGDFERYFGADRPLRQGL
jgi:hypothetical protein